MNCSRRRQDPIAQLYLDHHLWLKGWLSRRLANQSDAPDLLQSTFEQVLRRPQGALNAAEPRGWITGIARHLLIDHQRRQQVERAFLDALAVQPEAVVLAPEERMIIIETVVRLDALLSGLGTRAKKAFLLSRLDGMAYAGIARCLGVSLRTVENDMARAIAHCVAVRRELQDGRR